MAFLNKTFTLEKDENFKEFLESFGIPDDQLNMLVNFKPSYTLKKEGNQYILNTTTPDGGNQDLKFNDGVQIDEKVSPGQIAKTTFTFEGNVVTQTQKFDDGLTLTYRREYSDDKLVIVITSNKWDGTVRRYFKAA